MAKHPEDFSHYIFVCTGKDCRKRGGKDIAKALKQELRAAKSLRTTRVLRTRCTDNCKRAPVVAAMPANRWVMAQSPEDTVRSVLEIVGIHKGRGE